LYLLRAGGGCAAASGQCHYCEEAQQETLQEVLPARDLVPGSAQAAGAIGISQNGHGIR
jgi:hypothetical protein